MKRLWLFEKVQCRTSARWWEKNPRTSSERGVRRGKEKKKGKRNLFVPYCLYPPPLCTHRESLFSKAVGGEHRGDKAGERGPVAVLLRTTHHFFRKNKTQPQLPRVEQLNNPLKRICVCRKTQLLNSENAGWSDYYKECFLRISVTCCRKHEPPFAIVTLFVLLVPACEAQTPPP